jgi:hypothetical protein
MARIRSVHPGLFTDEAFMAASAAARVLLIGLWTEADDQGVFEWKPLTIKARLLPADMVDISDLLSELENLGQVMRFEHESKSYGALKNFRKYQRPQKPTAVHPLPEPIAVYVGLSATATVGVSEQSATPPGKSPQMEDEGGGEDVPSGSNEPSGESARELSARAVFETILTPERAKALTDGRNRKKAAQTAHAAELVVAKLKAFADPNAAADLMILKGWTSIEPEWGTRNGLKLAQNVVPLSGVAPGVWIQDDDPRWPACVERWARERGRRPSADGSRHHPGIGHSFPADWPETKQKSAEAAA